MAPLKLPEVEELVGAKLHVVFVHSPTVHVIWSHVKPACFLPASVYSVSVDNTLDSGAVPEPRERTVQKTVKSRWKIHHGLIGPPDCPMVERWYIETPLGSVRLHHFLRPDDERHAHDHPWSFLTFVLKGGYEDWTPCPNCRITGEHSYEASKCRMCGGANKVLDKLRPGSVRYRPAEHTHWVVTDDAWTLMFTGPERRLWGFWVSGVFKPMADYFARYGYAACE